ncbi:carotenoid oxygenase family protein [Spirosoma arcticum]
MGNLFKGGLETQPNEITIDQLPVRGKLPAWLTGALLRTGPAQFEVGPDSYRHWFDGLAMLHRFAFADGRVSYRNRFLQSLAFRENNAEGRIKYADFATDPCKSLFKRVVSLFTEPDYGGNGNVNISKFGADFVTLTEYPLAMVFDPKTLDTLGVYDYDGTDAQNSTAHPHHDRERDLGLTYAAKYGITNEYRFYSMQGKQLTSLSTLKVDHPAYVHSFGLSGRYVILAESALRLSSSVSLALSGKPFIENFEWTPEDGSRFIVIDKVSGQVVADAPTEAFFVFHHVNAFERDDELIVDLIAYPNDDFVKATYLDHLLADGAGIPAGELRRYRIPLNGKRATYELLTAENVELPRIHYDSYHTRGDYNYVYAASVRRDTADFYNQLTKVNLVAGTVSVWHEDGCYPGEPVFVPAPDGRAEDAGVILSVVFDSQLATSFLLVLDAQSFGEIARATVPQHIPFGFHGQYFTEPN